MTFLHKIRLVFARINWFLRLTENSRKYHESLREYKNLQSALNFFFDEYQTAKRELRDKAEIRELVIKVELLKQLINGK